MWYFSLGVGAPTGTSRCLDNCFASFSFLLPEGLCLHLLIPAVLSEAVPVVVTAAANVRAIFFLHVAESQWGLGFVLALTPPLYNYACSATCIRVSSSHVTTGQRSILQVAGC